MAKFEEIDTTYAKAIYETRDEVNPNQKVTIATIVLILVLIIIAVSLVVFIIMQCFGLTGVYYNVAVIA